MGGDSLGLVFEISANSEQAQAELAALGDSSKVALDKVIASTQPLNESLLNQHQSVHLLAEEMGIHLPRAVVGAVSEMIPNINMLGGAMLGVFAVEEIYKFGKAAVEMMHDLEGETKELKADWEDVIKEQEKLLRNPKSIADAQKDIAETNSRLADAASHIADLKKQLDNLPFGAAIAAAEISHFITQWEDEERSLEARLNAQIETYGKLGEAATKAHDQAAKAAERHAAAEDKAWEHAKLLTFCTGQQFVPVIDGMTKSIDLDVVSLRLWEAELRNTGQILPIVAQHVAGLVKPVEQVNYVLHQNETALHAVGRAMQSDVAAQSEQLAAGLAGMIAGRKAQAAVEAVWETAQGIKSLAEGIWGVAGPNPAAIVAAGLHFEAAAQFAIIAGSGGGKTGGGGGGGGSSTTGGNQSSYTGGPGGGGGGGGGGKSPTFILNWHQFGPPGNMADFARTLAAVQNQLVGTGQIKVVATNALTNGPKQT